MATFDALRNSFQASRSNKKSFGLVLLIMLSVLILVLIFSLFFGSVPVSLSEFYLGLLDSSLQTQAETIVSVIRFPRVLLAAIVGALLAVSGAVTQGLFRNPLADPSLIGVTAGASAGGSVVIVMSASLSQYVFSLWLVSVGAFLGGIVSVWLVYRLATTDRGTSVATMLLVGIAITALASSVTSGLEFVADNAMLRRISLWKMGGLEGADYPRILIVLFVLTITLIILPKYATALNAMLLGESEAGYLGVDVERVKKVLIILVAAAVGSSVAVAGTISFLGLIVPHIMRRLIGADHRYLLIFSALAGAILLMIADTLARFIVAPAELPVGLVTALLGAPFFIFLLVKRRHYD
ncbi:iron ABC transporter permease [Aurantivibrio infirmus]